MKGWFSISGHCSSGPVSSHVTEQSPQSNDNIITFLQSDTSEFLSNLSRLRLLMALICVSSILIIGLALRG